MRYNESVKEKVFGIVKGKDVQTQKSLSVYITESMAEKIYRKKELEYKMQDAREHAEAKGVADRLSDTDYKVLAERFISKQDCNLPENDVWEYLVMEYAEAVV